MGLSNNLDEITCNDSKYGCCSIKTICDSYIKMGLDYDIYNNSLLYEYPHGYVHSLIPKLNKNGDECSKDIHSIILSYNSELYKSNIFENDNNIINYMINESIIIGIIISFYLIRLIYNKKIDDINDDVYNNNDDTENEYIP